MTTDLKTRLEKHRDERAEEDCVWTIKSFDNCENDKAYFKDGYNELLPLVLMMAEALEFYANKKSWDDRWYESPDGNTDNDGDIYDVISRDDVEIQTKETILLDESFNGHYTFGGKRAREALSKLNEGIDEPRTTEQ